MKRLSFWVLVLSSVLILYSCGGGGGGGNDTPTPAPPAAPTATLNASATTVSSLSDEPVTLTWTTTNATSVSLLQTPPQTGQTVSSGGSMTVSPTVTTTYALSATGSGGAATAQVTIEVTLSADELVKDYNIEGLTDYGFSGNGKTMRWLDGTVNVYDSTGFSGLQSALDAWNAVIGGSVVLVASADPNSPITIKLGSCTEAQGACGCMGPSINTGTGGDNSIYQAFIQINPNCTSLLSDTDKDQLYLHELGHAIGFFAHTQDGGLMDATGAHSVITPEDASMIQHLYELSVGTAIP